MMRLGLFDVIGPIMHGPSSNHTGGATRIGFLARQLMGGVPRELTYSFHPMLMTAFMGHRTHMALTAGCLGIREDNPAFGQALDMAREQGITLAFEPRNQPDTPKNYMGIGGIVENVPWQLHFDSVGGGTVELLAVDDIPVHYGGGTCLSLLLLRRGTDTGAAAALLNRELGGTLCRTGTGQRHTLLWLETGSAVEAALLDRAAGLMEGAVLAVRQAEPVYPFPVKSLEPPLFSTFEELLVLAEEKGLYRAVVENEMLGSQRSEAEIVAEMARTVEVMADAMEASIRGGNPLIGGITSGNEGRQLADYAQSGKTLAGAPLSLAMARGVALAEYNACGGLVVAAPTAGSVGSCPGVVFTAAETLGRSREELVEAFIVLAGIGTVIGAKVIFSGGRGGCQTEVGVAAALGAAGAAYLAGGDAQTVVHAAALTLKNTLGLTCDPPAGPVEVPCIKRNGMGAAVAYMGAEMALAGLRSAVHPDDVVDAMRDTEDLMPDALKGVCTGHGLSCQARAREMQDRWMEKLSSMNRV